jgi:hypothetical protein
MGIFLHLVMKQIHGAQFSEIAFRGTQQEQPQILRLRPPPAASAQDDETKCPKLAS